MSYENALFQERVVRVECPSAHWTLLRAPNGEFLGVSDECRLPKGRGFGFVATAVES